MTCPAVLVSGHVCERRHLVSTGCCDTEMPSTRRYQCDSCSEHGCCSVYEHCISCCLHPDKVGAAAAAAVGCCFQQFG